MENNNISMAKNQAIIGLGLMARWVSETQDGDMAGGDFPAWLIDIFGTRLTTVTRFLRYKDVDDALGAASSAVEDWSGGTRIGDCLKEFNFKWSRRVLGHGAIVLFISDGLDRGGGIGLSKQMNQIQKSSKRLIWLNPLLRFDEVAPKPTGVKAILPYVDEFRPIHSLASMDQLVSAISQTDLQSRFNMSPWLQKLREIGHITAH